MSRINEWRLYVKADGTYITALNKLDPAFKGSTSQKITLVTPDNGANKYFNLKLNSGKKQFARSVITTGLTELVEVSPSVLEEWTIYEGFAGADVLAAVDGFRATDTYISFTDEIVFEENPTSFTFKGTYLQLPNEDQTASFNDNDYIGFGSALEPQDAIAYVLTAGVWNTQGVTVEAFEDANGIIKSVTLANSDQKLVPVSASTISVKQGIDPTATDEIFNRVSTNEANIVTLENQVKDGQFQNFDDNGTLVEENDTNFSSDKRVANHVSTKITQALVANQIAATIEEIGGAIIDYIDVGTDILYNNKDLTTIGTTDLIVLRDGNGEIVVNVQLTAGNIISIIIDNFGVPVIDQPGPSKQLSYLGAGEVAIVFDSSNIPNATETLDGLMSSEDKTNHNTMVANTIADPLFDGNGKVLKSRMNVDFMSYEGTFSDINAFPASPEKGDVYKYTGGTVNWTDPVDSEVIEVKAKDYFAYNGADWDHLESNDAVDSIQGQTGAVTLALGAGVGDIDDTRVTDNETDIATNVTDIATNVTNIATNASGLAQELIDRAAADVVLQDQIDTNDTDILILQTDKEDLSNKKITMAGNEASDEFYLTAKAIQDELDKKTSINNNNSFTSKVTGFGTDEITWSGADKLIWTGPGIIKFVRRPVGEDLVPTTHLRNIKTSAAIEVAQPGFNTNPFVDDGISALSAAYMYEDALDLITQDDLDNDLLLTDPSGEEEVVGAPKVKLAFTNEPRNVDLQFRTVAIALMQHYATPGTIENTTPIGITSTQGVLTVGSFDKGNQVYNAEGNDVIIGTVGTQLSKPEGLVFITGARFGDEGVNPNYINVPAYSDAKIFKVVPDATLPGQNKDIVFTNGGLGWTEITANEFADTGNSYAFDSLSAPLGTKTLISVIGFSPLTPDTLYQIMPQATDIVGSSNGPVFDTLANATAAISAGQVTLTSKLLNTLGFFPVAYLATEVTVTDFGTQATQFAIVPIAEIGGKINFVNTTGDLPATSVFNTGIIGTNNQQEANIKFETEIIENAADIADLEFIKLETEAFTAIGAETGLQLVDARDLALLDIVLYDEGVRTTEGTHYSVNRSTKVITFTGWTADAGDKFVVTIGDDE